LAVLDQHTLVRASGRRLRRSDLGSLRPLLLEHLATHDPLMAGTGVIFALEVLEDTPRWLEWYWRAAPGAAPTFLSVGLNPAREDFYDYERAAWYDTPRRSRSRTLVGPHVDHGATRQHLVTPCVPVVTESDDFLGVAAADLRVRELE